MKRYAPYFWPYYENDKATGYCKYKQIRYRGYVSGSCHSSCETCFGFSDRQCLKCANKNLILQDFQCVSACYPGRYYDRSQSMYQCQSCDSKCATCTGPSETQCLQCKNLVFDSGSCVKSCAAGKYFNNANNQCATCSPSCINCYTLSDCSVCQTFMVATNPAQKYCTTGCRNNELAVSFGPNRICITCQSPCLTCTGTTSKCLSCTTGFFYNSLDNTCGLSCPFGYVGNAQTLSCVPCDSATSYCENCVNTPKTCTKCISGYNLYNSACYQNCERIPGISNLYNSLNGDCQPCHFSCSSCRGNFQSAFMCKQCILTSTYKYFYDDGFGNTQCLTDCPQQTFKDDLTFVCKSCYALCQVCHCFSFLLGGRKQETGKRKTRTPFF